MKALPAPLAALMHSSTRSAKDADTVALVQYLGADQKFDKVLENQQILREPIVRNGRQATVGYQPDVWKGWE